MPGKKKSSGSTSTAAPSDSPAGKGERIAKVIARAGLCSRRDAERWIAEGRVTLDGAVLDSPAVTVTPDSKIMVDGKPLPRPEPARLWRYHKPKDVITTARDPQGRPTVFDQLPSHMPRVQAIGRLDINSEGLLLLTNDGGLKRQLELPATGWLRRYRVRVHGRVDPGQLKTLEKGVTVAGINYGPVQAVLERQTGANAWISFALREGKNREVRRICEHLGLTVNRLIRIAYGPFQLGQLEPGKVQAVPAKVLSEQLPGATKHEHKIGTAKAKPKAKRRPQQGKPQKGKTSLPKTAKRSTVKQKKSHANRRRPT